MNNLELTLNAEALMKQLDELRDKQSTNEFIDKKIYVVYHKLFVDFMLLTSKTYSTASNAKREYNKAFKKSYDAYIEAGEKTTPATDRSKSDNMDLYLADKEGENLVEEYKTKRRAYQFDLLEMRDRLKGEGINNATQNTSNSLYNDMGLDTDDSIPF